MLERLKKQFDKVKLQHFNEPFSRRNGKTIAVLFDDDKRYVGISECSKKDYFNKKKGRTIALGRAIRATTMDPEDTTKYYYCFNINDIPKVVINNIPEYLYTTNTEVKND